MKAKESLKLKEVSFKAKVSNLEKHANYRNKEVKVLAEMQNPDGSYIKFDKNNPEHLGKKIDIIKNGAFQKAKQRGRKKTEKRKEATSLRSRTRETVSDKSKTETSHSNKSAAELATTDATPEITHNDPQIDVRGHFIAATSLAALSIIEDDQVRVTIPTPVRLLPGALSRGFFGSTSRPENPVDEVAATYPTKFSRNT